VGCLGLACAECQEPRVQEIARGWTLT
jgi:hypothetical protein